MPPSPNKRMRDEAEAGPERKRARFAGILTQLDDRDINLYESPWPIWPDPHVAQHPHQAEATPRPSSLHSQLHQREATSQSLGPSSKEGNAGTAGTYSSTLGWNNTTKSRSRSALAAGHITSHLGGSVEAQRTPPHSPINFPTGHPRFTSATGPQESLPHIFAYPRRPDHANDGQEGQATPPPLLPPSENAPIPSIARSVRLCRVSQNTEHSRMSEGTSSGGGDLWSFSNWLESHPQVMPSGVELMRMAHASMMASIEDMPDEDTSAALGSSYPLTDPTHAKPPAPKLDEPIRSVAQPSNIAHTTGHNSPPSRSSTLLSSSPSLSSTSSSSPSSSSSSSLSSLLLSSSHRMHPARIPVGETPQTIILWLIHNQQPGFVSSLVHEAFKLTDPDSELGDLVERALTKEGDEFEDSAYNTVTPHHSHD